MKPQNRSDDPLAFIDDLTHVITQSALICLAVVIAIALIAIL